MPNNKRRTIKAADLFCGAGGTSTGLLQACSELGHDVDLLAINHWDIAIQTHTANHPGTHTRANLFGFEPSYNRFDLLWASMECTNHSRARGKKPRCDKSRSQAFIVTNWLVQTHVDRLGIENVVEFSKWDMFPAWIESVRAAGYHIEWRILVAADYGDATTRERFIMLARRDGMPIQWPEPTHSKHGDLYTQKWRSASEIIDWNIPGKDITKRKKPLVAATMRRITDGLTRFQGSPFIISYYGNSKCALSINDPLDTVTTKDRFALIVPQNGRVLYRLFQPHELAAAMGFPKGYKFSGNKSEIVKQIGNAVPVNMSAAVCKALLA